MEINNYSITFICRLIFLPQMKKVIVFFLILFIAFQWLGGLFTISLMDAIVVKTTMSAKEKYIAEHLSEKYNVSSDANISVVDPANYVRMGYGAPFIFSEEISGETAHFSISNEDTQLLLELKELSIADLQQNANLNMVHCFFPIFLQEKNPIQIEKNDLLDIESQSIYKENYKSVSLTILLPPPNFKV